MSTGISTIDSVNALLALAIPGTKAPKQLLPGHIFLLRYLDGGVLKHERHTGVCRLLMTRMFRSGLCSVQDCGRCGRVDG